MLTDGPLRAHSPRKSGKGLKLHLDKAPPFEPTPTPDAQDNHRGIQRANAFKRTVQAQIKDTKGAADRSRGLPFLGVPRGGPARKLPGGGIEQPVAGTVLNGMIYKNIPASSTRATYLKPVKGLNEDPVLGLAYDVIEHPGKSNFQTIMNLAHQGYLNVSKGDEFKLATGRHNVNLEPGPRIGGNKKGSLANAGAGESVAAPFVAPAIWGLKQSTRPLQGALRATDAALKGKNPASAALHGLELKGEDVWGTDIAHDLGLHGTAATVAGVGIDLLGSKGYPKFALGSPAKLLRERAERAVEAGDQAGATKLFARAEQASQGRAPQIGHDFHIPFTHKGYDVMTTGERPGRILKALHGDKDRLRGSTLGKVIGNFNPGMRPAGLTDVEHTADRRRLLREQAEVAQRTTKAERELHVLTKTPQKDAAAEHVFDTAERAPLVPLLDLKPKRVLTAPYQRLEDARSAVSGARTAIKVADRRAARVTGEALARVGAHGRAHLNRALALAEHLADTGVSKLPENLQHVSADAAARLTYFKEARAAHSTAALEKARATKAFINAHGFHPEGKPLRGKVTGGPGLYSDAERAAALERYDSAAIAHEGAQGTYRAARQNVERLAEEHTSRIARGEAKAVPNMEPFTRRPTSVLRRLEARSAEQQVAREQLTSARQEFQVAKAAADKSTRPREVTKFFTPEGLTREEAYARQGAGAHEPGALNPDERKQLAFLEHRNQTILEEAQKAGLLGEGRENYIRHALIPQEGNVFRRALRGRGKAYKPASARGYGDLSAKEVNALREAKGKEPIFSRNPAHAQAVRENEHAIAMAHAHSMKALVRMASPAKAADWGRLPADRGFYKVTPTGIAEVTSEKKLQDALRGTATSEHEHVVVLPRQIADQEVTRGARQTSDVGRAIDRIMGPIKTLYTSLNLPKHDVSNLEGDVFNGYLAGTRLPDYNTSAAVVARMFQRARAEKVGHTLERNSQYIRLGYGRRMHIDDVIDNLRKHGIEGGFVSQGLREEATAGISHISNPGALAAYRRGEGYRENFTRVATGIGALRRGMTWDQAAEWVSAHHFNYSDLTGAEHVLRRAFPFYTFAARNTKLQVRSLLSNPGKYAAVESLRQELAKAAGLPPDWENHVKPSVAQGVPFPIKWSNGKVFPVVIGGLPLQDLNRIPVGSNDPNHFGPIMDAFRNEFDKTASNLNMVLKPLVELGMNHNVFFRGPIYPDLNNTDVKRYVQAPSWAAHLPGPLKDAMGVHMILDKDGNKVVGWNSITDYLVRSIPQTNLAVQFFQGKTKNSRGQTLDQKLLAQAFNLNSSDEYGNPTQALNDLYNELDHITLEKNSLEERGGKFSQPWAMLRLRERVLQGRIKATKAGAASGAASAKPGSTGPKGGLALPGGLSRPGAGLASPSTPLRRP